VAGSHRGAQGLTPYITYNNWMNYTLSAPVGKTAGANYGRFSNPAAQSALAAYANATTQSGLKLATTRLANIQTSQVPGGAAAAGRVVAQFSTRNYTGWPTAGHPTWIRARTSRRSSSLFSASSPSGEDGGSGMTTPPQGAPAAPAGGPLIPARPDGPGQPAGRARGPVTGASPGG
jgi:peptide/nickel transport system substrate-binding protein